MLDADPIWARQVVRGLRAFTAGVWILVCTLSASLLFLFAVGWFPNSLATISPGTIRTCILSGISVGGAVCALGLLLSATPDPRETGSSHHSSRSLGLRAILAIVLATGLVLASGLVRAHPQAQLAVKGMVVVGSAGAILFGLRSLADLADRVPATDSAAVLRRIATNASGLALVAPVAFAIPYQPVQRFAGLAVLLLAWYLIRTALELPSVIRRVAWNRAA